MKTRGWLVAAILCTVVPYYGISQCGTQHTVSYDTTINASGSNGDDPFVFTFPRFDGNLGTLTDVNISTAITLQYNYDIENTEANPKTFRLKVTRYDDIYSSAFSGALSYNRTFPNGNMSPQNAINYYSHPMTGTDNVTGSGTDFSDSSLTLLNNQINNFTVPTANFIGSGNITLDYYTTLTPSAFINGTGAVFNSSASDQITLTLSYVYCDNILLNQTDRDRLTRPTNGTLVFNHKLYPNPSTNGSFTLQFHNSIRADWQLEIFNSTGQLVNRKKFNNVLRADMNNNPLPKGIYIIRATNLKSQETFSDRLLVK